MQYVCADCGLYTEMRHYLNGSDKARCATCHNVARYAVLTREDRLELSELD